jgi:hypothetical protein
LQLRFAYNDLSSLSHLLFETFDQPLYLIGLVHRGHRQGVAPGLIHFQLQLPHQLQQSGGVFLHLSLCRVRGWRERRGRCLIRGGSGLGGFLNGCGFRLGRRRGSRLGSLRRLAGVRWFCRVLGRHRRIRIRIWFQWLVVGRRRTNGRWWLCRVPRRQLRGRRSRLLLLGFSGGRLAGSTRCRGQSKAQQGRNRPSLK